MRNKYSTIFAIVIFFFSISMAHATTESDELIAIPKKRVKAQRLERILLKRNVYFKTTINSQEQKLSFNVLKIAKGENLEDTVKKLKKSGLFELIEPNYKLESDYIITSTPEKKLIPNDRAFKNQYYLDQTNVTNSWLFSKGASGTLIAVLDSGIDYSNLDLNQRLLICSVVTDNSYSCEDKFGHGTKVASIIGSNTDNDLDLAGITWFNPILPIKVSNEKGIATVSTVIKGLEEATNNKAKIAVISLSTNKKSDALGLAVQLAVEKGILIFASGGNSGLEEIRYPAGFDGVIGVGSTTSEEKKASFSTTGTHIKIVAPGENILVPSVNSKSLEFVDGNSFSTPQLAGIAALIWAIKPEYTNKDISNVLFSTAKDLGNKGYDTEFGYGQVDALSAIERVLTSFPLPE